jgi:hypothetical protein
MVHVVSNALVQITAAKPRDVEFIGTRLRAVDVREVAAALGNNVTPVVSMMLAVDNATRNKRDPVMCIRINDEPMAIFGVYGDIEDGRIGNIWMLTTDKFPAYLKAAHRSTIVRDEIDSLFNVGGYLTLRATSYSENLLHHKWLRAMGFAFDGYVMSKYDHQFCVFTKKAEGVRHV